MDNKTGQAQQVAELLEVAMEPTPLLMAVAAGTQQAVSTALKDWQHTARACLLLLFTAVAGGVFLAVYNVVVELSQ